MPMATREPLASDLNLISGEIVDAALQVHSGLGPRLLESAYEACLAFELRSRGFQLISQALLPIEYKGVQIDAGYRIDLIVSDAVTIELKCVDAILPVH
jgi:GxxExxY protein